MEKVVFVLPLAALACLQAPADSIWLDKSDYGNLVVVMTNDSPDYEREAATEFVKYWERATGIAPRIVEQFTEGIPVYIGLHSLPNDIRDQIDLGSLDPDGIVIKTFGAPDSPNRALVLVGAGDRGTAYAVYEFLERYIGVRWLAADAILVPQPADQVTGGDPKPWTRKTPESLPQIDFRYLAPLHYRWTTVPNARELRLTTYPDFGLFVHTVYDLLPPDKYFPEHPEYYAEIDGKRTAPVGLSESQYIVDLDFRREHGHKFGQLCFTNPEVAEVVAANLLERMRANPKPLIWSVSQEDWMGYCECAECKALDTAEGTPMASLLTFVNRVAETVEQEFPDHYIETLAYWWSRQMPKTIKPRDNVIIRLCSIECDFARPLNDPSVKVNAAFARDIREWSQTARQLYIWDYTVNFAHYFLPHPNLQVLQPNIQFFVEHNTRGVFEQGLAAPRVELGYIRPYLLARLLWNPYLDFEQAKEEFIDLFYQETAPYFRKYLDLIQTAVLDSGLMMSTFDEGAWISKSLIDEARAILNDGIAAAESDEIRRRIEYEALAVEYAALRALPENRIEDDHLVLEYPESLSVEAYIEKAKAFGVPEFAENRPLDTLPKFLHPRSETLVRHPIVKLENARYALWIVPEMSGSVIRWRDKQHELELISGFRDNVGFPRTWQDWPNGRGDLPYPIAKHYDVEDKTDTRITLTATTDEELVLRRTMDLGENPDRLRVQLEMRNASDKPVSRLAKMHPEFYAQGEFFPEIYGKTEEGWVVLNESYEDEPPFAAGKFLNAEPYSGMAFFIAERDMGVAVEFQPLPESELLWFYNTSPTTKQVNLELLPPPSALPPGGSITLEGIFYPIFERPHPIVEASNE